MIEDPEILAEIDKLSPLEALVRADHYWMMARAIHVRYGRHVKETDLAIDIAAARRRVRQSQREILRAVRAELKDRPARGRDLKAAIAAVATRRGEDGKTAEFHYQTEATRRRLRLKAMRDVRIILAVRVRGEPAARVAARFGLHPGSVRKIVLIQDTQEALDRLKEKIAHHRGPPLAKAPLPAPRSPLADADPREGDEIIEAEIERWRQLRSEHAALGRRCRSRPRIKTEALDCLRRALAIASRGMTGIAAKLEAADQLRADRLSLGLALAALGAARLDAERLAEGGRSPAAAGSDGALVGEIERFRELWAKASAVGRRNLLRPALKRQAAAAVDRALRAPASGSSGVAAKLQLGEAVARVKAFRRLRWVALAAALADAQRLAGRSAKPAEEPRPSPEITRAVEPIKPPAGAPSQLPADGRLANPARVQLLPPAASIDGAAFASIAPAADADEPIMRAVLRWYDAHEEYSLADDRCCRVHGVDIEDPKAPPELRAKAQAWMAETDGCWDVIMTAPALTVVGIAAKMRMLSLILNGSSFWGDAVDLFHVIVADASRVASGRDLEIIPHAHTLERPDPPEEGE